MTQEINRKIKRWGRADRHQVRHFDYPVYPADDGDYVLYADHLAEIERLKRYNPCGHTGVESFVCDKCGYPDSVKYIAALQARIKELEEALERIINWKYNQNFTRCPSCVQHEEIAKQALKDKPC